MFKMFKIEFFDDEVLSSKRDMILKDTYITIKKVNWSDKVSNQFLI